MATPRSGSSRTSRTLLTLALLVAGPLSLRCAATSTPRATPVAHTSNAKPAAPASSPLATGSTARSDAPTLKQAVPVPQGSSLSTVYGAPLDDVADRPWAPLPLTALDPALLTRPPEPATAFGWTTSPAGEPRLALLGPLLGHYFSNELRVELYASVARQAVRRPVGVVAAWELYEGTLGSVPCSRALSLQDAAGTLIAFRAEGSRVDVRELDLVPGHTLLQLRIDQDTNEGQPERWRLVDVDEGRFRDLASAQLGVGWTHPPPGAVEVTYGATPKLVVREPEEERTYCSARAKCAATERVLEWDASSATFVERSRKKVWLSEKPGPLASAVKS